MVDLIVGKKDYDEIKKRMSLYYVNGVISLWFNEHYYAKDLSADWFFWVLVINVKLYDAKVVHFVREDPVEVKITHYSELRIDYSQRLEPLIYLLARVTSVKDGVVIVISTSLIHS